MCPIANTHHYMLLYRHGKMLFPQAGKETGSLHSRQGFRVVLKNESEKSPSAVLVCIHIFISGSIISSVERKVVGRKSP